MSLTDLFSQRGKPTPSTLTYDNIPQDLRAQALQVFRDAFGNEVQLIGDLSNMLVRERPSASFTATRVGEYDARLDGFAPSFIYQFMIFGNTEEFLDALELAFRGVNGPMRDKWNRVHGEPYNYQGFTGAVQGPDDAIQELNARFAQHGVGYSFSVEGNRLLRADSRFTQSEVVEPAWRLLHELGFEGPSDEFGQAHKFFREGEMKDAATNAVKALESTAKAICDERGWKYDKNKATAKTLLDLLFSKDLIPPELMTYFGGLRSALESGLPTIGNRKARHGQGRKRRDMEDSLASLAMHLCAASIFFLCQVHKATK